MLIFMKSIFWRLFSAFIFIILISVLLSAVIEYSTTSSKLPHLLTEIRSQNMAQILGAAYTRDGGWGNIQQEIKRMKTDENTESSVDLSMRFVVKDKNGKTLYNSFSDLIHLGNIPLIEGNSVQIEDRETSELVGRVTIYISRQFLEMESARYLVSIFKSRILQGLISILILIFVAAFLSRRITAPIIALTKATQSITQSGEASLLPVKSSDEIGLMSESFNKMILSLKTQKNLRKKLISDVSHEINTPLSVIKLEAMGLNDSIVSSKKASNQIIDEVDTLSNLVHDLDWLAETDSGEYKLDLETYSIERLIKTEVERWQLKAELVNTTLEFKESPSPLPDLTIDVVRMSQVLGNLIENGIKYTPPGTRLTVECRREEDRVVIAIQENGPGIASEELPFIFERFYRVDQSRVRNKVGRGLGLSIVKQIVELHQGRVWAESSEGKGCCFFVSLPY
ncbi:HAMP domain-containing sensor histidine kinase [Oceanispirochaeta sp.]|jgi:two-component system sensor histidine kinase BaeS|uniref:HAMP domain-containing sensor histidine kinase n=1 Tax=Oceanispirochaeta sp. TaxID=2035350 RepID=UPI002613ED6B|nr:HAMP domain-containing sensor histidine kinase [Oceanispirochaeta sp.]MDA3956277.1 HAMP domain-containing sensor histidine kinase [Oceanispirochaeta sp.]